MRVYLYCDHFKIWLLLFLRNYLRQTPRLESILLLANVNIGQEVWQEVYRKSEIYTQDGFYIYVVTYALFLYTSPQPQT